MTAEYRDGAGKPVVVTAPAVPLTDRAPEPTGAGAAAEAWTLPIRRWGNLALNARGAGRLPAAPKGWRVERMARLADGLRPIAVLTTGAATVVEGVDQWQLLDALDRPVAQGALASAAVTLDPAPALFYTTDYLGHLEARRLTDGKVAFGFLPLFGRAYSRDLIVRAGSRLIFAATELDPDPFGQVKGSHVGLVAHELGDLTAVEADGLLAEESVAESLFRVGRRVATGFADSTLVVATTTGLHQFGLDLRARQVTATPLDPVTLSLGDDLDAFVVIRDPIGLELWGVARDGHRFLRLRLPDLGAEEEPSQPPIVGPGRRVLLRFGGRLLSIAPPGVILWEHRARVSSDAVLLESTEALLVTDRDLVTIDSMGRRQVVYRIGADVAAAPALTPTGDLLVPIGRELVRLSLRR